MFFGWLLGSRFQQNKIIQLSVAFVFLLGGCLGFSKTRSFCARMLCLKLQALSQAPTDPESDPDAAVVLRSFF